MKSSRFPHPLTLLTGCILAAAVLTYVLPAGQYEREYDAETDRTIVVAGTFERVDPDPVGPFDAFVAIPRGLESAADVVFLVFLIGGAFTVVDKTGALRTAVHWMTANLGERAVLAVPVVSVFFAIGGVVENMQEEIIPLIPVVLILTRRLGFTALTAVSMSAGAAFVGSAFSPINPFQVGIAQRVSDVPLLSGGLYRSGFLALALGLWIVATMRNAMATRVIPTEAEEEPAAELEHVARHGTILGIVALTFAVLVWGLLDQGWDFNQMSGLFVIMGVAVGVIGRLGLSGTAAAFADGFREMAFAGILIGFARAISVVLEQGLIIDTIVHGLFTPLAELPLTLSAIGMMLVQTVVHVPVPSVSGQAVLTMPVITPLADLLGMSRQVAILAYHYGAGLCDLLTPTNGALMAILATAGVRYEDWVRFATPLFALLMGLGAISITLAIVIGLQ
jgi:uncharacterized ion transporter superfamily protein YfcC